MEETYHTVTINGKEIQVKDGYRFIGWFVGDKEYDFSQPVTGNLTIEARFEKISNPTNPDEEKPSKPDGNKPSKPDGEKPSKPDANKPGSTGTGTDKNNAVQTGDQSDFAVWAMVMTLSAGAVFENLLDERVLFLYHKDNAMRIRRNGMSRGREVKELREQMGMNRREFCDYFGIPYRTVQDWEAEKRELPEYVLRLLQYRAETEHILSRE